MSPLRSKAPQMMTVVMTVRPRCETERTNSPICSSMKVRLIWQKKRIRNDCPRIIMDASLTNSKIKEAITADAISVFIKSTTKVNLKLKQLLSYQFHNKILT